MEASFKRPYLNFINRTGEIGGDKVFAIATSLGKMSDNFINAR